MPNQVLVVVKGVRGSRVISTNTRSAITADEISTIQRQTPCRQSHGLKLVPETHSLTMQSSGARCTSDPKALRNHQIRVNF